ncbi:MAG: HAMP domain-containing sensor histidine kinase, partial [Erysipelotrichaceae bacterium]
MNKSIQFKTSIAIIANLALMAGILLVSINIGLSRINIDYLSERIFNQYDVSGVKGDMNAQEAIVDANIQTILTDTQSLEARYNQTIILITVGVFALGALLSYLILAHFYKPLKRLSQQVNSLDTVVLENTTDEIMKISQSYNDIVNQLKDSLSAQKRFNVSVAHELKTPLAIIKTNIDVLNQLKKKDLTDYQETMDLIHQTVKKMNSVIETLLDSSTENQKPLDEKVNLDEVISDVVSDLKPYAKDTQVELNYTSKDVPLTKGNQVLLYRAFFNLIENAIKYNHTQGRVTIQMEDHQNHSLVRISDDGVGMDIDTVNHIFEPFYRAKDNPVSGLGLGLALVSSVIQRHSGCIRVI